MRLAFKIILPVVFFLLFSSQISAKSGCCSSHGGVSCSAEPQANGKVVCNDGWTGSSCLYSEMVMCGGNSASAQTPTYTVPPTVTPVITVTISPTITPIPTLTPTMTPQVQGTSTTKIEPTPTSQTLVAASKSKSSGNIFFDFLVLLLVGLGWKYRKLFKEKFQ